MATRTVHRQFPIREYGHTAGNRKQARGWRGELSWRLRAHLAIFMVLALAVIPALFLF